MGYITFDQLKSTVAKLKNYIDEKKAKVTQTLTTGTEIGSVDGTKLYAPSGGSGAVSSVNGKTGAVTLDASDVGALPDTYSAPVSSVNGKTGAVQLTASDVGAKPSSYTAPVSSVNGKTGAVKLSLGDSVAVTQKQTSGTNIADIKINGQTTQLFAPSGGSGGSTVSVTQKETTGTNIADITVDGVTTQLFAPSGGGGSSTLTTIETTAITIPQQQLKDDAHNMQPIFLQITCNDNFNYACFGLCNAEIENGVMLVYVHQLWGHAYNRVFGQSTGTLREILPLLTLPFSTMVEYFTVPATLVSGNTYEISGAATFKSQYVRGTYAYRESIVSLS